jgi:flagellar protein FliT
MQTTLIGCYQAIEESSRKMLDAALQRDWDAVVEMESTCAVQIEHLRLRGRVESLDAQSRSEKTKIMLRILKNDAQIRHLAEPWLAHCERQIEGSRLLH